jgi:hypothetical protein
MTTKQPLTQKPRTAAGSTVAALCAIVLVGCGITAPRTKTRSTASRSALAAARCMRTHGVQNFPDPRPGGGMSVDATPGSSAVTIDGITFSGPTFQAAEKACALLGPAGRGNPPVPEHQKLQMLAFAHCMRKHGLPYDDPRFPAGGGIFGGGATSQTESNSPAFKHAATICNQQP